MPKTKVQGIIFGVIMSYAMAIGMEVYNIAYQTGFHLNPGGLSTLDGSVFVPALKEMAYMGILVFLFSNLWGNRLGAAFARKHVREGVDNPYLCRLMRQAGTVAVMCPTMSLVASVLFSILPGHYPLSQLPAIWIGTVMKNFRMALFWNMFAAAPFTHFLFKKLFPQREHVAQKAGNGDVSCHTA